MTTVRLKKRGTMALIAYFLLITALCAPLAFLAGRAQGKVDAGAAAFASQNEPDLRAEYAALYRARRAGAGCGGTADPATENRAIWEITCHPYHESGQGGAAANPSHAAKGATAETAVAARRKSPLNDATVATLAATPGANGAGGETVGSPLSLALAPSNDPSSIFGYDGHTLSSGGFGAPFGGLGGGPNAPGGLPGVIIPNIPSANISPPSTVVTPVPGALPLLLTGLAGLFAAARRRNRR